MATYEGVILGAIKKVGQSTKVWSAVKIDNSIRIGELNNLPFSSITLDHTIETGSRQAPIRVGHKPFTGVFHNGGRRTPMRAGAVISKLKSGSRSKMLQGIKLKCFKFDSHAGHKFMLTVTPTHQYQEQIINVQSTGRVDVGYGKYQVKISDSIFIPFSSENIDLNNITFTITPSDLNYGNSKCLILYKTSTDTFTFRFNVTKEENKRAMVERTFFNYDGGYTRININRYPLLSISQAGPGLMSTENDTAIPIQGHVGIAGISVLSKGITRHAFSFDGRTTWKTLQLTGFSAGTTDVVPAMTNYTTAGFTIAASSEYSSGYASFRAFNDVTSSSGWATSQGLTTGWLSIACPGSIIVVKYSLTPWSTDVTRMCKDWMVVGSDDGESWTTLDTQENQTGWGSEKRFFEMNNRVSYRHYRLVVTANNGNTQFVHIGQMELFGAEGGAYVWEDIEYEDIASQGMINTELAQLTSGKWAEIFQPLYLDMAVGINSNSYLNSINITLISTSGRKGYVFIL